MRVTFLGTGTSTGIPMIGCRCPVCTSPDPRNRRRRASIYIVADGTHLVVDTPPDFREQCLTFDVPRVDALFYTHAHADHIFGFDDIRRFNTMQGMVIPAYAGPATIAHLRLVFGYAETHVQAAGLFRPEVDFRVIPPHLSLGGLSVEPVPVRHGSMETLGYVFRSQGRSLGYVPDCCEMPAETLQRLKGVDVMILDALKHKPHVAHLSVRDSVDTLQRIGAKRSFIIHMCHDLDHEATERDLPDGIRVSFDGHELEV